MGNCLPLPPPLSNCQSHPLPIETMFHFPSPLPNWPPGLGFAGGTLDLGGLQVRQVTSFAKVWATQEGGPGGSGATFFEPSPVPDGFSVLGHYAQPNNRPLFGWVLVAKDTTTAAGSGGAAAPALKRPIDYTLVWSSQQSNSSKTHGGGGYIWSPTPPDGYKAAGHVVTASPEKPSLEKVGCVRSDLTEACETDEFIWARHGTTAKSASGFSVFSTRPSNRGTRAQGVGVGAFGYGGATTLACLRNDNFKESLSRVMPNLSQIKALFEAYAPVIYFHPKEEYLPCSVEWFFSNGAVLRQGGKESDPRVAVEPPEGANLPQGGTNDGAYWLDLPTEEAAEEKAKKGNLESSRAYVHVKPMLGATFTDMAAWIFYPYNGAARAELGLLIPELPLGKIGEHVGDWEHLTLRISNFDGSLRSVFFSQHSKGRWVGASELEFYNDDNNDKNKNKPVGYSSLNGHATYPKAGLVLQGIGDIGIRNDAAKSDKSMDAGELFTVVAAEYLSEEETVAEPPWLNYAREWGPKISYEEVTEEIEKVKRVLPGKLKSEFEKFLKGLPAELLGQEGPTGPKMKNNWDGDEVSGR